MKLGNVLYYDDLVNHTKKEYINYYKNENLNEIDLTLPTIIVGWEYVKRIISKFNTTVNILDSIIIKNKLYWSPSFEESINDHLEITTNFVDNVPMYFYSYKYKFEIIDPIFNNIYSNTELIDRIGNGYCSIYRYNDDKLYILFKEKIIGIDIDSLIYYNFNIESLIDVLSKNVHKNNIFIDKTHDFFYSYKRKFPYFNRLKSYIVAILYININS